VLSRSWLPVSSASGPWRTSRPWSMIATWSVHGLRGLGEDLAGYLDGEACCGEALQQVTQPEHALGVQAIGRLVEDQDLRVGDQRPGQAQPLAHAG
jgi:hypothetical protein